MTAAETPVTATQKSPLKHLFLVDGSGYIFRAYYALKTPMNRPDGTPVGAVYGFINMLLKLLKDAEVDHIAVIFDHARKNFRNDIYPDYKANREAPPEDLIPQFDLIRDATRAMNLPCVEMEGFEADDLIATYARQAAALGSDVTIVSSDKDLMQLVDGRVNMMDPINNRAIGPDEVVEKFGVGPEKVVDVQALAGDSTDNVPGVPGIGVKTAAQLIGEYDDLDTLLDRAEEIKQPKRRQNLIEFADQARMSRELVRLRDDVPVAETLDDFAKRALDPELLMPFLEEQAFKSIIARLESELGVEATGGTAAGAPAGDASYELVQTEDALTRWIDRAYAAGIVGVDTETTSLDAMQAELVGISMAVVPGEACYIPVGHKGGGVQGNLDLGDGPASETERPPQIALDTVLGLLRPLLADPSILKVGHNLKYDMQLLHRYDVPVTPVDDTMVLSYVLEAGMHGHGLDELAELHLGHRTIKFKEVAGSGKDQVTFDHVPLDKACDYAAEDADITLRLHQVLKPRLATAHKTAVYERIERPLIDVLVAMECAGILVDRKVLEKLSKDFTKRLGVLEKEIYKLADGEFNIGSPKQLGEILFDRMGISGGRKTKTGAYGTGADVLEGLAAQGHDLPARILDHRQLAKLKSTYTDALVRYINPDTGRVHTSYGMAIASTGRLSSTDPNLQNIPVRTEAGRKIREAFVAAEGNKLVSLDYSQIELRLLAHVADVASLKDAFHAGLDIHAMTASEIFGLPIEGMDPMVRRNAKAINFGIIYGISAYGLANNLGIPQDEAAAYIKMYFERYPGIRDYMDAMKVFCREHGYVETPFGRRIHITGIRDKNPARRGFSERAAINAPLQGGAADIIKRAMIRVPGALDEVGLGASMLLQVHDELLFEVAADEVEATITAMKQVMEGAALPAVELSVPLVVDAGVGDNWAEAH
ncbi:MAG: DNA polymerase I [Alphaproteobacteria bacterium]|nr:DNA polymerase I [Alphaproteobacteria bacterium]